MDLFVKDRNGAGVDGANFYFYAGDTLLGSTESAQGRASFQIDNSNAAIKVVMKYKGITQEALLAQGQTSYDFKINKVVKSDFLKDNLPVWIGLALLLIGAAIAFIKKEPSAFQKQIILVFISLGGGGVGSVIPGFLKLNLTMGQKFAVAAAGAMAIFVITFFFVPAGV
ncbi:MAG TPA: hypothetical protein VNH64_05800 [Parvularculaceae bacterium]|nr:hypothetical protein [Parvularculaceae bacterium]